MIDFYFDMFRYRNAKYSGGRVDCDAMMELLHRNQRLEKLASNPLMCILLCLLFEENDGWLPDSAADLFAQLMRFVMARSLQQPQVSFSSTSNSIKLIELIKRLVGGCSFIEKYEHAAAEDAAGFRPFESAEDEGEPLLVHGRRAQERLPITRHPQVT